MPHNDILAKLKDAIAHVSNNIQEYVVNPGSDFTRGGKLPPDILMALLIGQGSKSSRNELIEAFNFKEDHPTESALVQKRAKLQPSAFSEVFYRFNNALEPLNDDSKYRFFGADGSTFTFLSDSRFSDDDYFTTQGNSAAGCYSVHLTAFLDLDTDRYSDAVIQPITQKDEYGAFSTIVDRHPLPASAHAVFIADRGFCSFNNMAHVIKRTQYFLFRSKDIHSKGILSNIDLPPEDEFDISLNFVIVRRQLKNRKLPDGYVRFVGKNVAFDFVDYGSDDYFVIPVRIVRFRLSSGEYESLITNLPADEFPPQRLKEIYFRRWGIETSFRTLKYTVGTSKFHARKASYILQEIWARLISYNFTSAVISCVKIPTKQTKHPYKISIAAAVLICRKLIFTVIVPADSSRLNVIQLLARELVPIRNGRSFPRLSTAHFRRPAYFTYRPS